MPSKRMSSACVDYVPALCTHRPSLLPIEWLGEAFGLAQGGRQRPPRAGKFVKLGHLEDVKVVTRFFQTSSTEQLSNMMILLQCTLAEALADLQRSVLRDYKQ